MRKKTLKYISLLLLLASNLIALPVEGQAPKPKRDKETLKAEYKAAPFYQGSSVGVEAATAVGYLLGGDILGSEIQFQSNLKNRYLPVLEVGYGKTNTTNTDNEMHYQTSAPYFRIGMDYNAFYLKPYLPGYLYVGARYGMSSFSYSIDGPEMKDPNYGGHISVPFSLPSVKSNAHWLEAVVGIKVKIYKRFCMGWAVRYKIRMSAGGSENSVPWYVPGFGKTEVAALT